MIDTLSHCRGAKPCSVGLIVEFIVDDCVALTVEISYPRLAREALVGTGPDWREHTD